MISDTPELEIPLIPPIPLNPPLTLLLTVVPLPFPVRVEEFAVVAEEAEAPELPPLPLLRDGLRRTLPEELLVAEELKRLEWPWPPRFGVVMGDVVVVGLDMVIAGVCGGRDMRALPGVRDRVVVIALLLLML